MKTDETKPTIPGNASEAVNAEWKNLSPEALKGGVKEQTAYFPQTMSERIEWETLQMQIKDNEAERELRKSHANKAFWLTAIWAFFLSLTIFLKGVGVIKLDRVEFLTVIGALTTSVFGFYLLVMKFLFVRIPGQQQMKDKKP